MRYLTRALTMIAALAWALAAAMSAPASAEPANDNPWVSLAPIPELAGLEGHCTSIIGNRIYTAFGYSAGDTNRLRIYDIDTNTWTFGPAAPTFGRSEHYRGVAKGGKLFCLGGRNTNETWSFDTATMTWSPKAPMPDAAHIGTTAATFGNSIFVFGGRAGGSPCSSTATVAVRRYDVDKDAWFPAGTMAVPRSDATVARVGGFIYIFGGCNGNTFYESTEKYDPRTGVSVIVNTTMPGGPRADAAAGDPQNGSSANAAHRVHVTGGWSGSGTTPPVANNHLIYDVDENTFSIGVPMPTHCTPGVNRAEHELVHGTAKIIALGGSCPAFGTSVRNVDEQKLSDPPAASASITAYACNDQTFPQCDLQSPGAGAVFVVGTGFAALSSIQITSSQPGVIAPILSDVQGELTDTYVDTSCDGTPRTLTAVDTAGNTASTTFSCP